MDYIEYMNNLRGAMRLIRSKVPEVMELIADRAERQQDQDLKIAALSDAEWLTLQERYDAIEEKLYEFSPEDEYGKVRTMWASEMRGEE